MYTANPPLLEFRIMVPVRQMWPALPVKTRSTKSHSKVMRKLLVSRIFKEKKIGSNYNDDVYDDQTKKNPVV
jgi:hypothetical protein